MAFRASPLKQPVRASELKICLVMIEGQPFLEGLLGVAFPAGLRSELIVELLFMHAGVTGFAEACFCMVKFEVAG